MFASHIKGVQEPYRYEWRCKRSGRGSVGDLLLEFCQQLGLLSEDCKLSHNGDQLDQARLLQDVLARHAACARILAVVAAVDSIPIDHTH